MKDILKLEINRTLQRKRDLEVLLSVCNIYDINTGDQLKDLMNQSSMENFNKYKIEEAIWIYEKYDVLGLIREDKIKKIIE